MALDQIAAQLDQVPLFGSAIDSYKHFDMYDFDVLLLLFRHMNWDRKFINLLYSLWNTQIVIDKLNASYGSPYTPSNGLAQGCTSSLVIAKLTASIWCRALGYKCNTLSMGIFVDDRAIRSRSLLELRNAEELTVHFDNCLGNIVNLDKSVNVSTNISGRKRLRGKTVVKHKLKVVDHFKYLGYAFNTHKKCRSTLANDSMRKTSKHVIVSKWHQ